MWLTKKPSILEKSARQEIALNTFEPNCTVDLQTLKRIDRTNGNREYFQESNQQRAHFKLNEP